MVLHAIRRSDEAYKLTCKKNQASILLFSALKQWISNDIPSIDYCAIIILVYDKNRKFIDNFIVNA